MPSSPRSTRSCSFFKDTFDFMRFKIPRPRGILMLTFLCFHKKKIKKKLNGPQAPFFGTRLTFSIVKTNPVLVTREARKLPSYFGVRVSCLCIWMSDPLMAAPTNMQRRGISVVGWGEAAEENLRSSRRRQRPSHGFARLRLMQCFICVSPPLPPNPKTRQLGATAV